MTVNFNLDVDVHRYLANFGLRCRNHHYYHSNYKEFRDKVDKYLVHKAICEDKRHENNDYIW